jgi:chromosome segregation ATPase
MSSKPQDPNQAAATEAIIKALQHQRDNHANDVVNVTARLAVAQRQLAVAESQIKTANERIAALEKEVETFKKPAPAPNGAEHKAAEGAAPVQA